MITSIYTYLFCLGVCFVSKIYIYMLKLYYYERKNTEAATSVCLNVVTVVNLECMDCYQIEECRLSSICLT